MAHMTSHGHSDSIHPSKDKNDNSSNNNNDNVEGQPDQTHFDDDVPGVS